MESYTSEILDSFFLQTGGPDCTNILVRHQIESMNEFMEKQLLQIIQGFNPIQICHNYSPELGDFKHKLYLNIIKPNMAKPIYQTTDGTHMLITPHLARMNNLSYISNLYVDIHMITETVNDDGVTERHEHTINNVCIGKIPIMVRSKACVLTQMPHIADERECRYDYGGYFIINGNEKVIISQDRISENKTLVFAPNTNDDGIYAEIRSMPDGVFLPPKTTSLHLSGKPNHMGNVIRMSASFIRSDIPLFVMFRALGVVSDREIYAHIVYDLDDVKNQRMIANLAASAEDACEIHSQEEALTYILRVMGSTGTPREYLEQPQRALTVLRGIIHQDFLSHVGRSYRKKALYLGYMVRKILSIHLGYAGFDNRDSYLNKRIDTPGILFSNLFRQCYGKLIKEVRNLIVRELNLWRANANMPTQIITQANVHRFFKVSVIETGLKYALSTGNWGVKTIGSFQNIRQGVAQVLNRMSYLSTLSHLRRINTPMEKTGKLIQPRKLENSQFGMICPSETPEGAAVGLVKNMALSTNITVNTSSVYVRNVLEEQGVVHYGVEGVGGGGVGSGAGGGSDSGTTEGAAAIDFLKKMGSADSVLVMINGDLLGYHTDPHALYTTLKHLKRYGTIPSTTSIVWDVKKGMIVLSTEAGRMCRPLHIVDGNVIRATTLDTATEIHGCAFQTYIAPLVDDHSEGFLEYMDVDEIDNSMVAMFRRDLKRGIKGTTLPPKFTHCEIYPALINGVLAANIPFMEHNQAPRNCYQCLHLEEPVLYIDGTSKAIKDVEIGDQVMCFNPTSMLMENTKVVYRYVRPALKPIYSISTISGRMIVATEDHKFATNNGWTDLVGFDRASTKLGIYVLPASVAATDAATVYTLLNLGGALTTADPLFPIVARLAGYNNSRASLGFVSFNDELRFNNDVMTLGFVDRYDPAFQQFITEVCVQTWAWLTMSTASSLVRREYLAGYLGGLVQGTALDFVTAQLINSVVPAGTMDATGVAVAAVAGTIVDDTGLNTKVIIPYIGYAYSQRRRMAAALRYEYTQYVANLPIVNAYSERAQGPMETGGSGGPPMSLEAWIGLVDIQGDMLMIPPGPVQPMKNILVADITVQSTNHSFIGGNGFAVSNSAMGKQAVGIYASNFNTRIDTMAHVLHYPQKPIVKTTLSKYTNADSLPSGINTIVAIMTYSGFNQEDSVMINQSAVDRGLFTSSYYKSYRDTCNKNHSTGEEEVFTRPDADSEGRIKPFNYDKLGKDGFVPRNTWVDANDVCVGKVMSHKQHGVVTYRDTSSQLKGNDDGYIDMNYQGVNGDGYKFCKIRLRQYRKPVIGDKLASRSAQKGTVGMIYRQEDMPFTKSGIVPDVIMNPHAIPSRMTIGQLMECIMGKAACYLGTSGDATAFTDCSVEGIASVLERSGLERYGNEILYNGRTGQQIQTEIFIGPVTYQRLKHMVGDKAHSRGSSGPLVSLTRQPAEGRARNGGLRFGEMERDAIVAHGASAFLKAQMIDNSDNYRVHICNNCGLIAVANPEKNIYKCGTCGNAADIRQVRIPYAMKLLVQELMSMSVTPRIVL